MKGDVINLAKQQYGCRVVQKVVQLLPSEEQGNFAEEIRSEVLDMMVHKHGNHVVQKCVENMQPESVGFIVEAVSTEAEKMASHSFGCRVIQRLIERCPHEQIGNLLDKLVASVGTLSQDEHGNYVVQCVLQNGRGGDQLQIIRAIRPQLVALSKKKVSSNVVEKCFAATTGPFADLLIEEKDALFNTFIGKAGDPDSPLQQLMHDKFGNYTVQCVIKHSRGQHREEIVNRRHAGPRRLHAGGGALAARPRRRDRVLRRRGGRRAADRDRVAPGRQVQGASHVLPQ